MKNITLWIHKNLICPELISFHKVWSSFVPKWIQWLDIIVDGQRYYLNSYTSICTPWSLQTALLTSDWIQFFNQIKLSDFLFNIIPNYPLPNVRYESLYLSVDPMLTERSIINMPFRHFSVTFQSLFSWLKGTVSSCEFDKEFYKTNLWLYVN